MVGNFGLSPLLARTPPLSLSPNRLCGSRGPPPPAHCPYCAASAPALCLSRLPDGFSPSSSSSTGKFCSFIAHPKSSLHDFRATYACFAVKLSWCCGLFPPAFPGVGRQIRSSCVPFNLRRIMRSSFSERLMNCEEEVPASSAFNDQDNHLQDMLISPVNGDDENGKLKTSVDKTVLPISGSKILTLPTILTLGRVAAIPILLVVFYSNEGWASTAVALIFVLAAITDWLDGFLARKMGSNSTFGAFLDPVADKLMVATTLVLLSTKPLHISWAASLPWLIPLPSTAIIGREITMSAVREWAASQGENLQAAVAVNKLGKWKTAFQMVALTVLLATRNGSESGVVYALVSIGVGLLYISAVLALWSLFVYMKAIWGVLVR